MDKNVLNNNADNEKNIFDTIEENVDLREINKKYKKTPKDNSEIPDNFTVGNVDNSTVKVKKGNSKNIFIKIYNWFILGIKFEGYMLYSILKYALIGLLSPVIFLRYFVKQNSIKEEKKRREEEKRIISEIQEGLKHKKEQLYKQAPTTINEPIVEEKIVKEDVVKVPELENKDVIKNSKAKITNVKRDFSKVKKEPTTFKEKLYEWYHNLPIIRDLDLQKKTNEEAIVIHFEGDDAEKSPFKVIYEYRAKSPEGKFVIDYFDAYSKVEVYSFLINEGYKVFNIRTSRAIQLLHGNLGGSATKFKSKDLIFFLTQLSTYLKAGIPLIDALKILSRQYQKNKKYQRVFRKMIYDLTMGENFSTALEGQGTTFPRLLINMVKTAEMTGELPDTLDKMAAYFTETHKTHQQMVTALTYPAILLSLSLIVFVFIMLYVVPRFVNIYNSMDNVQLPGITRAILGLSNFLKANIIWLILGITIVIVILVYLYKNIKSFRTVLQTAFMKIPVFGNIIIFNEVTLFSQTLGTLLSHNVFITDSMEIMNKITNNEIFKSIIMDTIENIAKGDKISKAFNHWAFPVPAYEMVVTGEKTGQLPEMMERVGSYYQELHRNEVARIKSFLEPILIIALTIIVGIIVLAIVIPMFNMYSAIEGF